MSRLSDRFTFTKDVQIDCLVMKGVLITPAAPAFAATVSNISKDNVFADIEIFLYFDDEELPKLSCFANGQFFAAEESRILQVDNGTFGFPDKQPTRIDLKAKITVAHKCSIKVEKSTIIPL